jgi:TP901-1 family phage major tail protein
MATNNVVNGTICTLKTGNDHASATPFALGTSASLSFSMDTRDISNKNSGGWRELLEAQKSWSASVEGLYAFTTGTPAASVKNYESLYTLVKNRTKVYLEIGTGETGDEYYYGEAYCTSVEQTAPMEDNMTFSATFEGTGSLSVATES